MKKQQTQKTSKLKRIQTRNKRIKKDKLIIISNLSKRNFWVDRTD